MLDAFLPKAFAFVAVVEVKLDQVFAGVAVRLGVNLRVGGGEGEETENKNDQMCDNNCGYKFIWQEKVKREATINSSNELIAMWRRK